MASYSRDHLRVVQKKKEKEKSVVLGPLSSAPHSLFSASVGGLTPGRLVTFLAMESNKGLKSSHEGCKGG